MNIGSATQLLLEIFEIYLFLIFIFFTIAALPRWKPEKFEEPHFPVRVIVPCKGTDLTLRENLESILTQDYGNFRITAVVDSEDDPSYPVIRDSGIEHLISRKFSTKGSGKVKAIVTALQETTEEIVVIVDSDVTAGRDWLRKLVSPLTDDRYGMSTTFPVFKPAGGFWSKFKSLWGLVGQGMMESSITRFGWGGSLAFRKSIVAGRENELLDQVSDDIFLTKACKHAGLRLYYEPGARATVLSDDNFPVFFEWANRQTALSISTGRNILYTGIALSFNQSLLYSMGVVFTVLLSPYFAFLLVPFIINTVKAAVRLPFKSAMLIPGTFIMPFFYFLNLVIAGRMKSIKWRGSSYDLQ
ncbi:MAG: glycosyltransferase family 2 protein [Thermoplasmataceae archaeon]